MNTENTVLAKGGGGSGGRQKAYCEGDSTFRRSGLPDFRADTVATAAAQATSKSFPLCRAYF